MPSTEAGTASPRGTLSKLMRNKGKTNASNISLGTASTDGEDAESNGGLRASVDAAIGKVKDRARRQSVDSRRGSDDAAASPSRRLSNLIPRNRRSKKAAASQERGLSAHSAADDTLSVSGSRSETASLMDESGHSSIFTDDGAEEGKLPRPTLSPHQSHAGMLTLSSPEFNTQTKPATTATIPEPSPGTIPTNDPLANIPHIVEPTNSTSNRSVSPAGKLKSAFSLPRKAAGGDGDTESIKSVSSGAAGLSGLFRPKSRRTSVSSQSREEPTGNSIATSGTAIPALGAESSEDRSTTVTSQPETPQQRKRGRVNTDTLPATPDNLVDTPTTLVTPPTPTDPSGEFSRKLATLAPAGSPPVNRPLSSIESIKHRRAQSGSVPSRLSNSVLAPLASTAEELKTPGGTLSQPTSATGFFSSFISATQKAADQLSSNITTAIGTQPKGKASTSDPVGGQSEEVIPGTESRPGTAETVDHQPAVDTLGKGDLSFSHLGMSEKPEPNPMASATDLPQSTPSAPNGQANNKAEEVAAARAVSMAYEKPVQTLMSQAAGRPAFSASQDRLTLDEPNAPQNGADADGIKRTGSIRSKISAKRRKHRASSATTGTAATGYTIAAALQSTTSVLTNTNTNGAGHRLTGFAVASVKRNKDFHQQFRSVPEDDYLIEDYSAALQRDILLHGRLYVSEAHVCFSSNIMGWVTNLVISFEEMVSVEKKSTAVIFPNAIVIQTLQGRNTFASLVARDSTYELLTGIWKISHPNLKSSLNGVVVDSAAAGDKTEVADPDGSEGDSLDEDTDDDVYDEDDDDDDVGSFQDGGMAPSIAGSDIGEAPLSRKVSAAPMGIASQTNGVTPKGLEAPDAVATGAAVSADFPGPPTHAATECGEPETHYDRPLPEALINAPLGKVYSVMWGPASNAFMRKWMTDFGLKDLNLPEDKTGLDNEHKTYTFDYIKPLNAPVGPRQTKCITTNTLVAFDLEKAVTIDCSTQTPDVPSGSVFTTKTRYCLMWAPGNATKIVASCTIDWTGKSWLKGPIESGANSGQIEYVKSITAALKAACVTARPPAKGGLVVRKGKRKGKRDVLDAESANAERKAAVAVEQKPVTWGPLEPLHQILDIVVSLFKPYITSQVIIAGLLALLAYSWFISPGRNGSQVGYPGSSQRLAAYEEMWRREESELWNWLEDRVGMDHLYAPSDGDRVDKQRSKNANGVAKKLEDERMSQRQMDDAVRVTEERLATVKEAVARKKGKGKGGAKGAKQEL